MPITLARLKRLNPGEYVIVGTRFRRVRQIERRKAGIGILLDPIHPRCNPIKDAPQWVLPEAVHIPGTPFRTSDDSLDVSPSMVASDV